MKQVIIGLSGHAGCGKDTAADYLVRKYGLAKLGLADELKRFCKQVFEFSDVQLWGPSENRNVEDTRFRSAAAWQDVFLNIALHGPAWTRALLPGRDDAMLALHEWATNLFHTYGPGAEKSGWKDGISPRIVLQTLGSEWGRKVDPTVWVNHAMRLASTLLQPGTTYSAKRGVVLVLGVPEAAGVVIPDCRFWNEVDAIHARGGLVVRLRRDVGNPEALGVGHHASEVEQNGIPDSAFAHVVEVAHGIPAFHQQLDALMQRIQETR